MSIGRRDRGQPAMGQPRAGSCAEVWSGNPRRRAALPKAPKVLCLCGSPKCRGTINVTEEEWQKVAGGAWRGKGRAEQSRPRIPTPGSTESKFHHPRAFHPNGKRGYRSATWAWRRWISADSSACRFTALCKALAPSSTYGHSAEKSNPRLLQANSRVIRRLASDAALVYRYRLPTKQAERY